MVAPEERLSQAALARGMKTETAMAGKNGKRSEVQRTERATGGRAERRTEERRKLAKAVVQHRIGVLKALEKH